ncbi:MAG: 16S rRNA (uracil1498-N3)-methyltransferase [Mariniblastus sp.]|jgi:16S rRNA (uracil1498-N3)-methyltransferase
MSHRFFLDSKPTSDVVILEGDQAHHASHVMRFKPGDTVVLFDGSGVEFKAEICEIAKKRVSLQIVETTQQTRAISNSVTLAVALPKGDRQKFLIEKLVELGVDKLIPLKTQRSVAVANGKVLIRLGKQVIEASKQCGRNTLMEILPEQTLDSLAAELDEHTNGSKDAALRLIADPYQGATIGELAGQSLKAVVIAVGPEGGFDDTELATAFELGFSPVRFGPSILRVETACLVAATLFGIGRE